MKNLNDLKNKLEEMKNSFMSQYDSHVVCGEMSISDFAAMSHDLAQAIVALEKVIKELSNGMYSFNADNTISVTYLSHFVDGRFQHAVEYKTVKFSFIDCLRNLKHLNVNKYILMKAIA